MGPASHHGAMARHSPISLQAHTLLTRPICSFIGSNPAARKDEFLRFPPADKPRQPLGAPRPRNDGQACFRKPHGCGVRSQAQVAGQGQFRAATESGSIYSCNNGFFHELDGCKQVAYGVENSFTMRSL